MSRVMFRPPECRPAIVTRRIDMMAMVISSKAHSSHHQLVKVLVQIQAAINTGTSTTSNSTSKIRSTSILTSRGRSNPVSITKTDPVTSRPIPLPKTRTNASSCTSKFNTYTCGSRNNTLNTWIRMLQTPLSQRPRMRTPPSLLA